MFSWLCYELFMEKASDIWFQFLCGNAQVRASLFKRHPSIIANAFDALLFYTPPPTASTLAGKYRLVSIMIDDKLGIIKTPKVLSYAQSASNEKTSVEFQRKRIERAIRRCKYPAAF